MSAFRKWIYGGQDRQFFIDHQDEIHKYNVTTMRLILRIMMIIPVGFLLYDFAVDHGTLINAARVIYLSFFTLFFILYVFYDRAMNVPAYQSRMLILVIEQLLFLFLLIAGPIFDPGNLSLYIPVYFVVISLLTIMPMQICCIATLIDLIPFSLTVILCKAPAAAALDVVNGVCCTVLGTILGGHVLKGRLYEIGAYSILKSSSEAELARVLDMANRDALTGVRSRAAYDSTVKRINAEIENGTCRPFAVVVCDINGLKLINDSRGHAAGDQYILSCGEELTGTFANSPVFRIGGDEFCVILRGIDYQNCPTLIHKLREPDPSTGRCRFSSGCADYRASADQSFEDVFSRADAEMYSYKAQSRLS